METDLDLDVQYHLLVGDARSRKRKVWGTCGQGAGDTGPFVSRSTRVYRVGMFSFAFSRRSRGAKKSLAVVLQLCAIEAL